MLAGIMREWSGPPKSNSTKSFIGPDGIEAQLVGSITLTQTVTVSAEAHRPVRLTVSWYGQNHSPASLTRTRLPIQPEYNLNPLLREP